LTQAFLSVLKESSSSALFVSLGILIFCGACKPPSAAKHDYTIFGTVTGWINQA
jgi:hypothetical protein